jgi:hypothetical protein
MGRPRDPATLPAERQEQDDLIRECSAMTALLPTVEAADYDGLREIRRRAREPYQRSRGFSGPTHTRSVPPTRADLDELWALVSSDRECWARGLVDQLIQQSRRRGLNATVQTVPSERIGVSS